MIHSILFALVFLLVGLTQSVKAVSTGSLETASGNFGQNLSFDTGWDSPQTLEQHQENWPPERFSVSDMRDGPNVYTYVTQNPWTFFDPLGLNKKRLFRYGFSLTKMGVKLADEAVAAFKHVPIRTAQRNVTKKMPAGVKPGGMAKHNGYKVKFDSDGFVDYKKSVNSLGKPVHIKKEVSIIQTADRRIDFDMANQAAGYAKTPKGYVWHHHQDAKTMQLVPSKSHAGLSHTGGVAVVKSAKKTAVEMGAVVTATAYGAFFPSIEHLGERRSMGGDVTFGDQAEAVLRDLGGNIDPTGTIVPSTRDIDEKSKKKDMESMRMEKVDKWLSGVREP